MEFKTPAQEETYRRVSAWMSELFGEVRVTRPDRPVFLVREGTAITHVMVMPWSDDDSVICARAYVVYDVEPTKELMSYLLHENSSFRFGAFGLDSDDDVFFEHSIVGSGADKDELRATVWAVAGTADKYDDIIVDRFGGQTALDRIKHAAR